MTEGKCCSLIRKIFLTVAYIAIFLWMWTKCKCLLFTEKTQKDSVEVAKKCSYIKIEFEGVRIRGEPENPEKIIRAGTRTNDQLNPLMTSFRKHYTTSKLKGRLRLIIEHYHNSLYRSVFLLLKFKEGTTTHCNAVMKAYGVKKKPWERSWMRWKQEPGIPQVLKVIGKRSERRRSP